MDKGGPSTAYTQVVVSSLGRDSCSDREDSDAGVQASRESKRSVEEWVSLVPAHLHPPCYEEISQGCQES